MNTDQDQIDDLLDMATFKKEAARLRQEFDLKTKDILDRIRERRMREIKDKIQS